MLFRTALGADPYEAAEEIAIGTVTPSGGRVAQSPLTFGNKSSSSGDSVQDTDQNLYQTTTEPGTLVIETDERPLASSFQADPAAPRMGETVSFDASGSTGAIVEYRWEFTGDGDIDRMTNGPMTVYTYEESSSRTVTLELVGEDGSADSTTREVSVEEQSGPAPPSAVFEVTSADTVGTRANQTGPTAALAVRTVPDRGSGREAS